MLVLPKTIKMVVTDFDGVITDNCVYINEAGQMSRKLNFKDIMAFSLLKKNGFKTAIISGEANSAIEVIKEKGLLAGVALNPATPVSTIEHILSKVDMILIMTVNPGFGGQTLIPYTIDKVRELRQLLKQKGIKADIEVDGGINLDNVEEVVSAGANIIVAGSAVFNGNIEENVHSFLNRLG